MESVKDRYIYYEKAGDQFVGQTVTGLLSVHKTFAVSLVYWDWLIGNVDSMEGEEIVYKLISKGLVDQGNIVAPSFELLPFLLASVVYHYD